MVRILSFVVAMVASTAALALDAASIPSKFNIPWGNSAGAPTYIRPIPQASQIGIQNCAASLTDGFPPLTFTQSSAGGCPPFGQDFNGILKQITQWSRWQSAGAPVPYDSTFQAAIGGYPRGTVVQSVATFGLLWLSTTDNNVTNPDSAGAGWTNLGVAMGATYSLGGVLTGNLPNPGMAATGVTAGTYQSPTMTVGADGRISAIASAPASIGHQVFSTTGAFSFTTSSSWLSTTTLKITLTGGGGGGGDSGPGAGGGAGATCTAWITGLSPSTSYFGVLGAGGPHAGNGITSSFTVGATTYSATGGTGAIAGSPGAGGAAANCDINIAGGSGYNSISGNGGISVWGGGGRTGTPTGQSGPAPGTGGGGGTTTGGAGANGIGVFEWVL